MIKLTIERSDLLKALVHVQSIVEKRQTIPILSNVLLETTSEGITLRATDNELEIVEKTTAQVEEPGSVTVPAHKLYEIVRRLPEGAQVSMTALENAQMSIVSGRSKFSLAILPADGFPTMIREDMPFSFSIASADILGLINKTSFAVSQEETRYNLNGIYFHEKKGEVPVLAAVATDGHRLACSKIALPEGAKGMPSVIIPRKTIGEISKLLSEVNENVTVALSDNQIRFQFGDIIFASRLIDGTYPEYEKVIPAANDKLLEADASVLAKAVERVSVVSEKSRGIKFIIKANILQITAAAADEGSAEDEMDITYTGEEIDIGFNYRYLLDILSQIKGNTVRMLLSDSLSPIILRDASDENALYVLMPMRV